jgi:hypothetical protein
MVLIGGVDLVDWPVTNSLTKKMAQTYIVMRCHEEKEPI